MRIKEYEYRSFADYEIDENCHLYKVEVFDRAEDSSTGTRTTVDGRFVHQDDDMRRNPSAVSGLRFASCKRHSQLPLGVAGTFMRASAPRPRISCMGMTAVSATDIMASLTISRAALWGVRVLPT